MTGPMGEPIGLKSIAEPDIEPPDKPDPLAAKEKRKYQASNKPSPAERHADSVNRHLDDICQDRGRLREENSRLHEEIERVKPENARLREAYGNALFNNVISTIFIAAGGALISGAGFSVHKTQVLWFGIALFTAGVLGLLMNTIRGAFVRG